MGQGTGDLNIQCSDGSILSITYAIEDCRKYIPTSSTASSTSSKLNNVANFGVLDQDGLHFSAILKTSNITNRVMGLCVVNNVQTSSVSPYPSGYCDYRVYSSVTDKGMLGGGVWRKWRLWKVHYKWSNIYQY